MASRPFVRRFCRPGFYSWSTAIEEWRDYGNGWQFYRSFDLVN